MVYSSLHDKYIINILASMNPTIGQLLIAVFSIINIYQIIATQPGTNQEPIFGTRDSCSANEKEGNNCELLKDVIFSRIKILGKFCIKLIYFQL